jgi:membrane protein DedA with SNARE-associated domain/rhodanese-related sulfurtransferase
MFRLLNEYGVLLVFGNVLLTQLGMPIPAVPTLVIAGAMAASGAGSLAAIVAASVLASTIADYGWYLAGRRMGYRVLATLCRLSLVPDLCVRQAETRYQRWGANLLLVAKFIPGVATVAPPLAGVMRMGQRAFILSVGLGGLLWAGTFVGIGYVMDSQSGILLSLFEQLGQYLAAVALVLFVLYIGFRLRQRKALSHAFRSTRVTAEEVGQLILGPVKPVLLDARSAVARQLDGRHIPGALAVDVSALSSVVQCIPKDAHVIVFCACRNEVSAAFMAAQLVNLGYARVSPLKNGIDGWAEAGLPLVVDAERDVLPVGELAVG